MVTRIKLGELLVRAGVLDETKLKAALAEQRRWGGRLGKHLVDMGFVSEPLMVKALSKQMGVPRADLSQGSVPQDVLNKLDPSRAKEGAYCPLDYDPRRKILTLAMVDPTDIRSIDDVQFRTGLRVTPVLAGEHEISDAIDRRMYMFNPASSAVVELGGDSFSEADISAATPHHRASASQMSLDDHRGPATGSMAPLGTGPIAVKGAGQELAERLDSAQKQQQKAIRVMLELLIEKGIFSQADYVHLMNRK